MQWPVVIRVVGRVILLPCFELRLYTVVHWFFTLGNFTWLLNNFIDYIIAWILVKDMDRPRKVIYCILFYLWNIFIFFFLVSLKNIVVKYLLVTISQTFIVFFFFFNGDFKHYFLIKILVVNQWLTGQIYAYWGLRLLVKNLCVIFQA